VKGSKISILVDKHGLPISIKAFPADTHDSKTYKPTIDDFKIKNGVGRPITRPGVINADAAYDSCELRDYNRGRGIKSNIPENERNWKHRKRGRPKRFEPLEYTFRRSVERAFSWLESLKRVAVRFEVREVSFMGVLYLAASIILWRVLG
jgi:transposase